MSNKIFGFSQSRGNLSGFPRSTTRSALQYILVILEYTSPLNLLPFCDLAVDHGLKYCAIQLISRDTYRNCKMGGQNPIGNGNLPIYSHISQYISRISHVSHDTWEFLSQKCQRDERQTRIASPELITNFKKPLKIILFVMILHRFSLLKKNLGDST